MTERAKALRESYDDFYAAGGWHYDLADETLFLLYRILMPLGIGPGSRAVEIGCGTGVHTEALRRLVGDAEGVDLSERAVSIARADYPRARFAVGDALQFLAALPAASVDLVFARGMSWFHAPLDENRSPHAFDRLMNAALCVLRPGGHFVLQIRTDFTGRTDPTGIHHHRFDELAAFGSRFGERRMIVDWAGLPLASEHEAQASGRNAIVAVRRSG